MIWWMATCLVMLFYGVSVTTAVGLLKWPRGVERFNYHNVDLWPYNHPTCKGRRQSPIDLNPDHFRYVADALPLRWVGYDNTPGNMTIGNDGHSLELTAVWPDDSIPYITGGPLHGEYAFAQLHFHWGKDNTVGSEHTADGTSFPMEMHMVHWKREYESFENALEHPDGLSVIGLFFEINEDRERVIPLNLIFDHIRNIGEAGSKVDLVPFPLSIFEVVDARMSFMTYMGSLTTPPCTEVVIWIIPNFAAPVSASQMQKLRTLKLHHNVHHNHRPIQERNERKIYFFLNDHSSNIGK